MRSAFGLDVRSRVQIARATENEALLLPADAGDTPGVIGQLVARASADHGPADAIALAHADDASDGDLDALRSFAAAAGIDAHLVPATLALTFAPDTEADGAVAIGAAIYALGRGDRSVGGIGGVASAGGVGGAAGVAAGLAGRAGEPGGSSMADFGSGRDMSQFGEGQQMSDFADRTMSDFGEGRDMSDFGQEPQQPAASSPPPPTAAPPPPPPAAKSKAKLAVAAAVVLALVAVGAVVALASGGGDDDTAVTTGGADTTIGEDRDDTDGEDDTADEGASPGGPSAGGAIVIHGFNGESSQIFVASPDGSEVRQVSKFGSGSPVFDFTEVEWGPEGDTIYFVGAPRDGSSGQGSLWALEADGSNLRQLTAAGEGLSSFDIGSDGRIVTMKLNLVVLAPDGSGERVVTQGVRAIDPAWTPDGAIVFVTGGPSGRGISRINDDGSGLQQLVATTGYTAAPDVSPDGKRIAWLGTISPENRNLGVWVANIDGTEARVIEGFEGVGFETTGTPRWSGTSDSLLMSDGEGALFLLDPEDGTQTPLIKAPVPTVLRWDIAAPD